MLFSLDRDFRTYKVTSQFQKWQMHNIFASVSSLKKWYQHHSVLGHFAIKPDCMWKRMLPHVKKNCS